MHSVTGMALKVVFFIVLVTYYYIITIDGKTVNVSLQVVCSLLNFAFNPPIIELIIIRIIESIHITNIFLMSLFSIKVDMLFLFYCYVQTLVFFIRC